MIYYSNKFYCSRHVTFDEGKLKQEEHKLHSFFEVSAKSGNNVDEVSYYYFSHNCNDFLDLPKYNKKSLRKPKISKIANHSGIII